MNEGLWSHERERMHNRWLEKVLGEFDQTLKPLPYTKRFVSQLRESLPVLGKPIAKIPSKNNTRQRPKQISHKGRRRYTWQWAVGDDKTYNYLGQKAFGNWSPWVYVTSCTCRGIMQYESIDKAKSVAWSYFIQKIGMKIRQVDQVHRALILNLRVHCTH